MNKRFLVTLIVVAILLLGVFMYKKSQAPTTQDSLPVPEEKNMLERVQTETTPIMGDAGKTYTLTEVATHGAEANCYTAINGKVYDLSAWINKHPGGDKAILSICGKDGSMAFSGKHGGQMKPEAMLVGFEVGVLVQ